jgi:hypothetical protein
MINFSCMNLYVNLKLRVGICNSLGIPIIVHLNVVCGTLILKPLLRFCISWCSNYQYFLSYWWNTKFVKFLIDYNVAHILANIFWTPIVRCMDCPIPSPISCEMTNSLELQVIVNVIGKSWDHFDPYHVIMFITLSRSKTILIWKENHLRSLKNTSFKFSN